MNEPEELPCTFCGAIDIYGRECSKSFASLQEENSILRNLLENVSDLLTLTDNYKTNYAAQFVVNQARAKLRIRTL